VDDDDDVDDFVEQRRRDRGCVVAGIQKATVDGCLDDTDDDDDDDGRMIVDSPGRLPCILLLVVVVIVVVIVVVWEPMENARQRPTFLMVMITMMTIPIIVDCHDDDTNTDDDPAMQGDSDDLIG